MLYYLCISPHGIPTRLTGHLIPQNINLWMGFATTASSSGLHHDYHDNLYILLRGTKHFTLYSYAEVENMYTIGEVLRVHPNGSPPLLA